MMRMVVGVIGHVDHGKTALVRALVRALTGMETDRLAVEQRRGISIALGFAHLMAQGVAVDLIDMPGHERFVRTMVSGATGVDAVLLVVAANEGIKPQTVEHLDITGLLGLGRVVVAVSKVDLVDAARAEAAAQEVSMLARDAGLTVCGTVLTSASTGQGIDALRAALAAAVAPRPTGAEDGFPYLPIDRVFSVPGHGTVATGTLRRGPLAVSDDVALAPGGRAVRLRGLQVHGSRTSVAQPGQRVAANLRDVEPGQIARGAVLRPEFDRTVAGVSAALAGQEQGLPLDRLAAALPWAGRGVLKDAVAELVRRGALVRAGGSVRVHAPQRDQARASEEAVSAGRLAEALRQGGLSPPDPASVAPGPQTRRLVDRLIKEGVVVLAVDKVQKREVLFHSEAVELAKRRLAPLLAGGPGVLVGEAGAALGISRKYCVPLLEHLDAIRFTRRIADRRVLAVSG